LHWDTGSFFAALAGRSSGEEYKLPVLIENGSPGLISLSPAEDSELRKSLRAGAFAHHGGQAEQASRLYSILNPFYPCHPWLIRFLYDCAEFALLLDEFCDETGPTGLMRRAEASAGVGVKIFVEPITILIALLIEAV